MSIEPEGFGAEGPDRPASPVARSKVNVPGILLIVVGVLNVLIGIWGAISGISNMMHPQDIQAEMAKLTPEQRKQMEDAKKAGFDVEQFTKMAQAGGGGGSLAFGIINILGGLLTLLGGVKMRNLESYGLALFGSILALIPCVSYMGCCALGEVAGIWALVVLMSQDVKSAFR